MEKNSFISNFKKLPLAFLGALAVIALLETSLFTRMWILTDWNMLSIFHKKHLLNEPEKYDAVFFGDSVLWSLDAKNVQSRLNDKESKVYNYYIANLGPSFNLSLTFKQYIKHKPLPEVIFLSVRPVYFYDREEGDLSFTRPYQEQQFRRYIEWPLLVMNLPYTPIVDWNSMKRNWRLSGQFLKITKDYITHFLPSLDFSLIFRDYGPPFINLDTLGTEKENFIFDEETSRNRLASNRDFLAYLKDHQGQLLVSSTEVVADGNAPSLVKKPTVKNRDIEEIVKIADSKNIPVVFFFMPQWDEHFESLGGKDYMKPVNDYLRQMKAKYPRFSYFEHMSLYARENFMDEAHLNKVGTEKFNEEYAPYFADILEKAHSPRPS